MLSAVQNFFQYSRVLPVIELHSSAFFFWFLYGLAIAVITLIVTLFIYILCSGSSIFLHQWSFKLLETLLVWTYWVLFTPFAESLLGVFKCENGRHKTIPSLKCFQGLHIFLTVLSILFVLLLFGISVFGSVLFNESQPAGNDKLAKNEDAADVLYALFRVVLVLCCDFLPEVKVWVSVESCCVDHRCSLANSKYCTGLLLLCVPSVL